MCRQAWVAIDVRLIALIPGSRRPVDPLNTHRLFLSAQIRGIINASVSGMDSRTAAFPGLRSFGAPQMRIRSALVCDRQRGPNRCVTVRAYKKYIKPKGWQISFGLLLSLHSTHGTSEMSVRAIFAALVSSTVTGCTASVAISPPKPTGLTCTAPNGAIVRLNLDLAGHHFQKEGFPSLPFKAMDAHRVVLMRHAATGYVVTASIDRSTMDYVALSEDRRTHARTETRYACVSGAPFEVPDAA